MPLSVPNRRAIGISARVESNHGSVRERTLRGAETSELRAARFTYPEIGGTRGDLPEGYQHLRREVVVG